MFVYVNFYLFFFFLGIVFKKILMLLNICVIDILNYFFLFICLYIIMYVNF